MMKSTNRAIALAGASLVSVLVLSMGPGCSKESEQSTGAAQTGAVRADTYEGVLGVVATLPIEGQPGSEFKIHHEHIPGFKTKAGEVFVTADGVPGMKSMVMAFPVAETASIDGLAVGDPIRFTFEVIWGGSPPWRVTAIEQLDAGTEIDFGNKVEGVAPTGGGDSDGDAGHDPGDHDGHDHDGP